MSQHLADIFPLRMRRAHEVTGAGAIGFALSTIGQMQGHVLWIASQFQIERLHPSGLARFCDPARLIFSFGKDDLDLLWTAEEALRSGAIRAVVAQLSGDIDLTAGRRLQLAAEAGKSLGLFLLPQGAGSNAAETRWLCNPIFDGHENLDSTLFEWRCIKNKSGTNGQWMVRWDETAHHINLVSQAGERTFPQTQAG